MHVVGQNHPCVDPERTFGLCHPDRLSQRLHLIDKRPRSSVGECDCEEDGCAGLAWADVTGHGPSLPRLVNNSQIPPPGRALPGGGPSRGLQANHCRATGRGPAAHARLDSGRKGRDLGGRLELPGPRRRSNLKTLHRSVFPPRRAGAVLTPVSQRGEPLVQRAQDYLCIGIRDHQRR